MLSDIRIFIFLETGFLFGGGIAGGS